MSKVTTRYTKDSAGNWKTVAGNYEHPIPCKVCDRGTLARQKQYRLAGPAIVIGYILLIPSVIGMGFAILMGALLISASGADPSNNSLANILGVGLISSILLGSLVGGLLGWLLVMKKRVLKCSTCGATTNAS